jgi:hypothetical protein
MRLKFFLSFNSPFIVPNATKTTYFRQVTFEIGLLLSAFAMALFPISQVRALEEIRLFYGILPLENLIVQDLVDFSITGEPPRKIRDLINLNPNFQEHQALELLTYVTEVNAGYLREASYTETGERFFQLAGQTIDVPNGTGDSWLYLREALLEASADNRLDAIELLQEFDAHAVNVKTEKLQEVGRQIQDDEAVMNFLRTAFPEME